MRIGLAQMNCTVGDLNGNAEMILGFAHRALDAGCDLLVTPELAVTGYPPQDLLFKKHFITDQLAVVHGQLAGQLPLPALVGFVDRDASGNRYNAAALISAGSVERVVHKTLLPTYDVFDEWRYFKPAESNTPVKLNGVSLGVTICEDIWDENYKHKVVPKLAEQGAGIIINISSSPFHVGKRQRRIEVCQRHAVEHGLPVLYCNMAGAQDEIIFDGESIAVDAQGRLTGLAAKFAEDLLVVSCDGGEGDLEIDVPECHSEGEMCSALQLGISDYFRKCGFERAVIGLSGGIDSAVVAVLAAEALGPENVICVAMPSRFTSEMSNDDAAALAANLGVVYHVLPIEQSVKVAMERFRSEFGEYSQGITAENLQARERGKILMEISNDMNALVLATGNKTEYALGYTTLYGDMCGGLAVIGDVAKTEVYDLARYYNEMRGAEIIPRRIIERPPSAELAGDQVDPFNYERISPLADAVVEEHLSRDELLARGYREEEIDLVFRLVRFSEYKRRQAPPILRISEKAFGIGRVMPIVNKYRY
jgi:NAD+ synthetase